MSSIRISNRLVLFIRINRISLFSENENHLSVDAVSWLTHLHSHGLSFADVRVSRSAK
jgi:hypothetical protein